MRSSASETSTHRRHRHGRRCRHPPIPIVHTTHRCRDAANIGGTHHRALARSWVCRRCPSIAVQPRKTLLPYLSRRDEQLRQIDRTAVRQPVRRRRLWNAGKTEIRALAILRLGGDGNRTVAVEFPRWPSTGTGPFGASDRQGIRTIRPRRPPSASFTWAAAARSSG